MNVLKTFIILILIIAFTAAPLSATTAKWAKVQEISKIYNFDNPITANVELTLREENTDRPLYKLECHSGLYTGADADFYSGLLDCRLTSLYAKDPVSTLFSETIDQTTDWENRGRFLSDHLRPGCAAYPEWGQSRTFRLRGMNIVISLSNVKFNSKTESEEQAKLVPGAEQLETSGGEIPKSYSVRITVNSDPTSETSISQKPTTSQPLWFYHPDRKCGS
jgi:hypothetical protein